MHPMPQSQASTTIASGPRRTEPRTHRGVEVFECVALGHLHRRRRALCAVASPRRFGSTKGVSRRGGKPPTSGRRMMKLAGMTLSATGHYARCRVERAMLSSEAADRARSQAAGEAAPRVARTLGELKGAAISESHSMSNPPSSLRFGAHGFSLQTEGRETRWMPRRYIPLHSHERNLVGKPKHCPRRGSPCHRPGRRPYR